MKNEVFYPNDPADKLSLPVAQDTLSGSPVIVGSIVGVAATREGQGGNPDGYASVWCEGVYRLPVSTTTALTVGAPIYIIAGTYVLTPSSSGNTLFGYALEAKGTSAATIRVKLAKV